MEVQNYFLYVCNYLNWSINLVDLNYEKHVEKRAGRPGRTGQQNGQS